MCIPLSNSVTSLWKFRDHSPVLLTCSRITSGSLRNLQSSETPETNALRLIRSLHGRRAEHGEHENNSAPLRCMHFIATLSSREPLFLQKVMDLTTETELRKSLLK